MDSAHRPSGVASPLLPGNDHNGHGTHTAGTIAAAVNGIGITGVAPNAASIAGIKSSNDDGFFFPGDRRLRGHVGRLARQHRPHVTRGADFADPLAGQGTARTIPRYG